MCAASRPEHFASIAGRDYWRCSHCAARFLAPAQRPSRATEFAQYLTHENDPHDPRYRRFLGKLAVPLIDRLEPASEGLDYGSGPGAALATLLRAAGHSTALYDPFFQPDSTTLQRTYDFVTCTEAVEHFHHPAAEFRRLTRLVRPGGWLAIMTCFQTDDALFENWHYRRDPTHVVFYREQTMRYLAAVHGWSCLIPVKDVALMRRPTSAAERKPEA